MGWGFFVSAYILYKKLLRKQGKGKSYDKTGKERGIMIKTNLDWQVKCLQYKIFLIIQGFRVDVSQAETQRKY